MAMDPKPAPFSFFPDPQQPVDVLLSFENRERYIAQSAATNTGRAAPLPARPPLSRELRRVG